MKLKKLSIAGVSMVGLSLTPMMAVADYQSEISYLISDYDYEGGTDVAGGELRYKYYFDKISSSKKPLAEAAYLQRVSSIEAALSGYDVDYSDGDEGTIGGISVLYIHRDKSSPLVFEVLYDSSELEVKSGGAVLYERDATSLGVSAGWFIDNTTSVDVNIIKTDYEYSPAGYAINDYDTTDIFLTAKSVMLSGGETAFNVEGLFGKLEYRNDSNTIIGVAGDYYFNKRMSVGGRLESESGNSADDEGRTLALRGRFFFTDQLSLGAELEKFTASNTSGMDIDAASLELFYRF